MVSSTVVRRLSAAALATALVTSATVALAPGAAAASGPCNITSRTSTQIVQNCVNTPQTVGTGWVVGYRDSVKNNLGSALSATCTANSSTTVTYNLSLSVSAEGSAWIFAKVSATVSGGVSRSMSSGYSTSATFTVPARSTVNCHRGIVTQNFRSLRETTTQQLVGGKVVKVTKSAAWATGKAPSTAQWRIFA